MTSVSVVIPCHNCEAWVGRAIDSVLSQTYSVLEILLIENNSTDKTLLVLQEYEKAHTNLIKVYSEPVKGACAARNFGLFRAKGEWIQFLDADDELLPKKIEEHVKLVKLQEPDVIVSDYTKIFQHPDRVYEISIITSDDPWVGLINSTLGITSANLWRRESLLKVNGLDESLTSSQEYDLMFRLLQASNKFIIDHHIQTYVHKQAESISRTEDPVKKTQILLARFNLRVKVLRFLEENNLISDLYKQEIFKRLYTLLMSLKELNQQAFQQQLKQIAFTELRFNNKLKAYYEFVCSSSKIKYRRNNFILRMTERYFYVFTHLGLLRY
jgi:glycosyltransferase involved in cell wall biosynthesis